MKHIISLLFIATVVTTPVVSAAKAVAGPQGGRLLATQGHRTEFVVRPDRKVAINFYDAALKPVPAATQAVTITAEPKSGRTKVDLEKTATGFVSKAPLPEAPEPYRIVVQVRAQPNAKPQNFRVDLNLETCGECKLKEYACICEGH